MPAEQMPPWSPEDTRQDQANKQKERTLSDARLLQGGAEYVVDVGGGLHLEVTADQLVEIHGEMAEEFQRRFRDEIQKDIDSVPIEDIIASHPELAERIEAIPLVGKEGEPISLIRMRGVPAFAMPVWAKSKMRGGTQGRVLLQVPDDRLPKGIPHIAEFRSVCACCQSETREVQPPFQAHMPKWPEGDSSYEGKSAIHNRAMEEWRATEEGRQDAEWHEERKRAYRDAMQRACTENGIRFLVMRHEDAWAKRYGALEGVEMMEVTDLNKVREKMRTLRIGAGLPEEVQGFTVRS